MSTQSKASRLYLAYLSIIACADYQQAEQAMALEIQTDAHSLFSCISPRTVLSHLFCINIRVNIPPRRWYISQALSSSSNSIPEKFVLFSVGNRTALPLEHWDYDTLIEMALVSLLMQDELR
jgi:hypothetical protein